MPRLFDKLEAATGRTPGALDDDVDYLSQQPGPEALIGADRRYRAGWFDRFDGQINFDDSSALDMAFQRWIHLAFDAPEHFVVCNIADLTRAGNVALLVVEKQTGRFVHASLTRLRHRSRLRLSEDYRTFSDGETSSFVSLSEDLQVFTFSLHVEGIHLSGVARVALGPPLVQVTRFQRFRGSLQWYGAVEIVHATLTVEGRVLALPPGTLGTYDRTIGHQRGLQSWNWIAAAGWAVDAQTGERARFAVQVARDREAAHPRVDGRKYAVWIGGKLYKVPEVSFAYGYTDEAAREVTPWAVHSPDTAAPRWLRLDFSPRYHRRERKFLWLIRADFNQYYGKLRGKIGIDGRCWMLDETFAVAEESLLEL